MLDDLELARIGDIARKNIENAQDYAKQRMKAAKAKHELDALIASGYVTGELDHKMAYEKAMVLIGNEHKEAWKEYCQATASFKGLEKVIEANQSQIMLAQSMMKYENENT